MKIRITDGLCRQVLGNSGGTELLEITTLERQLLFELQNLNLFALWLVFLGPITTNHVVLFTSIVYVVVVV